MKPVNKMIRITAAAGALTVTFALVWSMASLGYPGSMPVPMQLAAATQTSSQ
jgi:hypothetical protein